MRFSQRSHGPSNCPPLSSRYARQKVGRATEKLYERVLQKVNDGTLGEGVRIINFWYEKGGDSRKIIRISSDTEHGVRTTIFVRFLGHGDNLYVALNAYVLGDLDIRRFLIKVFISSILLAFSWMLIPLAILILIWWKLVWRIRYEGKVGLAFRQEFPGGIGNDLFNLDDIAMFSQSAVSLIVPTMKQVFEEEGLPTEQLEEYAARINNITVDTGGGNILGGAIGMNNQVSND